MVLYADPSEPLEGGTQAFAAEERLHRRFDHEWFHLVCRAACVGVAGTAAVLAAAALGVEPQGRPLDPAAVPAVGAEAVICEAQTFLSALPFVVPVRASLL